MKSSLGSNKTKRGQQEASSRKKPTGSNVTSRNSNRFQKLRIKLINIQGLTQIKTTEIESETLEDTIFCITETQHKFQRTHTHKSMQSLCSWREERDTKGGGLMIMYKMSSGIECTKLDSGHRDILYVNCKYQALQVRIILIYMSTNNKARNKDIQHKVESILKKEEENALLMLGDFNGHVGFIGPQQCDDNGRMVLNWLEEYNLVLLNADPNCSGETTWSRGSQKSSIDFLMVNQKMYQFFHEMTIDEHKCIFDLSDHHLIEAQFNIPHRWQMKKQNTENVSYLKISDATTKEFQAKLDVHLDKNPGSSIEDLNASMKYIANAVMKRTFRKTTDCRDKLVSPLWFTNSIRKEISRRRDMNKKVRKATEKDKNLLKELYKEQKQRVHDLVKTAIKEHEKKVADEIMSDKNRSKRTWQHINTMINKPQSGGKNTSIYDKNGEKLSEAMIPSVLKENWKDIYQKHANEIQVVWNEEEKIKYQEIHSEVKETANWITIGPEDGETRMPAVLTEHMDSIATVMTRQCKPMEDDVITEEEVKKHLKRLKDKKAPGPDGLKSELYKMMTGSDTFIREITLSFNTILKEAVVPRDWKTSNTILIPKNNKPSPTDLRPIALLNVSYKLFMSIIKSKIEQYLKDCGIHTDLQAGFTERRRTTDNLFILKYCIEESYRKKRQLYVISIDFKKAFDSVNRGKLIQIMKDYQLHPSVINVVASIYCGDETSLFLNNKHQTDMEVTCGVRQGCNGSTALFLMVTFLIIDRLQMAKLGFRNKHFNISCLFYADDGLIFAQNYQDAKATIQLIIQVAGDCGLQLNKQKSMILVYNAHPDDTPTDVEGIKIVKSIKYLGFEVTDTRNCLSQHKINNVDKAKKMANILHSVVSRSYQRVKMGKTFWKGLAMPIFLYGGEVMDYTQTDLKQLQKVDNKAFRTILQAPTYVAVESLRGDIGASCSTARDMKMKLLFIKHLLNDGNELAKRIFLDGYEEQRTKWTKQIAWYMKELKLTLSKVSKVTHMGLTKLVNKWDTEQWIKGIREKNTLSLYGKFKTEIREEHYFTNDEESKLMFRARTDTLELNWRNKNRVPSSQACPNCQQEETLKHFLLDCDAYNGIRAKYTFLSKPLNNDTDEIMGYLLLLKTYEDDNGINSRKQALQEMWKKRKLSIP